VRDSESEEGQSELGRRGWRRRRLAVLMGQQRECGRDVGESEAGEIGQDFSLSREERDIRRERERDGQRSDSDVGERECGGGRERGRERESTDNKRDGMGKWGKESERERERERESGIFNERVMG
jgi:hypothetical protein